MKNQTFIKAKTSIRNAFPPVVIALMLLITALPATSNAAEEKKAEKSTMAPVEVKFLGQLDNQPVFEMNIDNNNADVLYLTLKDEEGNVLYGEKLNDKKISKKFRFMSSGYEGLNVTLNLTSKSSKNTQTYQISNVSKVVEDVVVTKIN
jgi:hypothetical protein